MVEVRKTWRLRALAVAFGWRPDSRATEKLKIGVGGVSRNDATKSEQHHPVDQNCLPIPACLSTALAVCLDLISPSTTKRRCVNGLNQISWSPLPGRSRWHPWARNTFLSSGVNEEPIQQARWTNSWRCPVSSKATSLGRSPGSR